MTDDTPKKQPEPLTLFPVSGKDGPQSPPGKRPKILPLIPMTIEEYERAFKEGLQNRPKRTHETDDGSS